MNIEGRKSNKKNLLRDLRIICCTQVISFFLGLLFLSLFTVKDLIPDYPEWDNIHLLCGALGLAFLVIFTITMLWGGYKIMDLNFIPRIFQFYAVSVWLLPAVFLVILSLRQPDPNSWEESIIFSFFIGFPIGNMFFLFLTCRWLGKN